MSIKNNQKIQKTGRRIHGSKVSPFILHGAPLPIEEALRGADASRFIIASNKRLSKALGNPQDRLAISSALSCWSGTMVAYDKPGKALGDTIEFHNGSVNFVFPVPRKHVGRKDVLLAVDHPNFKLIESGTDRIVKASRIDVIDEFPTSEQGWYLGDQKHDLPHGNEVDPDDPNARFLWREDKIVTLAFRDDTGWDGEYTDNDWRHVLLNFNPSNTDSNALHMGLVIVTPRWLFDQIQKKLDVIYASM
ncbi:hypothetical protein KKF81_07355 [Candidatus Micrarchaeota archaeon]|nr:hypothetical protein [Candidatus Micrarchaeota archaeon]MBU1166746.1 hypothetical protein [Candidatus Micrarchaeota archaeon]MBU1887356.1 hypothetical protein [Candidatus Micrarchaeota archaeon]